MYVWHCSQVPLINTKARYFSSVTITGARNVRQLRNCKDAELGGVRDAPAVTEYAGPLSIEAAVRVCF